MYGAIIGDLAGSTYEFEQTKNIKPIRTNEIITKDSFFSDDSILTMAILQSILKHEDYETNLKKYTLSYLDYKPNFEPYFKNSFSPGFIKWTKGEKDGNSNGNGAMMRISPVGYMFNTEEEVKENCYKATKCSHNTKEAIAASTLVTLTIFYARKGLNKKQIQEKLNLNYKDRKLERFNTSCADTIDICFYSLFSANNFKDAIKLTLEHGGDTDTNCCIVGSMAEALYGIDEDLIKECNKHIPDNFKEKLTQAYHITKLNVIKKRKMPNNNIIK